MGNKNGYLARRKERDNAIQKVTRQTFEQYMTDTLILVLHDPDVMGKDVFGYTRLKKILKAWGECYDKYFPALMKDEEADYHREKMDEVMKEICKGTDDFIPFKERYEWLDEITYDKK